WIIGRLIQRVPARAFRPVPSVDAGVLLLSRRPDPLVSSVDRRAYQEFVAHVFQGPGRSLREVLGRAGVPRGTAREMTDRRPRALPRDLGAEDWAKAFNAARPPRARKGVGRSGGRGHR